MSQRLCTHRQSSTLTLIGMYVPHTGSVGNESESYRLPRRDFLEFYRLFGDDDGISVFLIFLVFCRLFVDFEIFLMTLQCF